MNPELKLSLINSILYLSEIRFSVLVKISTDDQNSTSKSRSWRYKMIRGVAITQDIQKQILVNDYIRQRN